MFLQMFHRTSFVDATQMLLGKSKRYKFCCINVEVGQHENQTK